MNLTALLLIVCAVRHYGWQPAPDEIEAEVWNMVSAGTFGLVVWRVWSRERLPSASWAVAVLMLHELTTVACSAAWLAVGPWTVPKGVGQCSAAVGFDLDKLGAVLLLAAVVRFVAQPVRTDR